MLVCVGLSLLRSSERPWPRTVVLPLDCDMDEVGQRNPKKDLYSSSSVLGGNDEEDSTTTTRGMKGGEQQTAFAD